MYSPEVLEGTFAGSFVFSLPEVLGSTYLPEVFVELVHRNVIHVQRVALRVLGVTVNTGQCA